MLYIKFPGFFCWRAIYENVCKGLHEGTEGYWSSFGGIDLECQSPLGAFLRNRIVFNFFFAGKRGTYQIENIMFQGIS